LPSANKTLGGFEELPSANKTLGGFEELPSASDTAEIANAATKNALFAK
jgi:hypothetical protein